MNMINFFQQKNMFSGLLQTVLILFLILAVPYSIRAQEGGEISYPDLTPAGFLQTHFSADDVADNPANFSIHRARMGFTGNLSENIELNLIIGATEPPNDSPALVDAFTDFT
ncbi:MAG: hypothetical protein ACLFM7_14210, partial [Bacteroidales bacterium]